MDSQCQASKNSYCMLIFSLVICCCNNVARHVCGMQAYNFLLLVRRSLRPHVHDPLSSHRSSHNVTCTREHLPMCILFQVNLGVLRQLAAMTEIGKACLAPAVHHSVTSCYLLSCLLCVHPVASPPEFLSDELSPYCRESIADLNQSGASTS